MNISSLRQQVKRFLSGQFTTQANTRSPLGNFYIPIAGRGQLEIACHDIAEGAQISLTHWDAQQTRAGHNTFTVTPGDEVPLSALKTAVVGYFA